MNIIRLSIDRPIAVVAAVLMVILFGLLALQTIPIQLTPDVQRPVITVSTKWAGAAPAEIEREILIPQEDVLSGMEGVTDMLSEGWTGEGEITLEFAIGTDMNRALLLVANRLDRVSGYPDEADEPVLDTASSEDKPIARFNLVRADGNERPIDEYGDFVDDIVAERLERVPGVARVTNWGGSEREIRVVVTPENLARYHLTIPDVAAALRSAEATTTAGKVDEGKRQYTARFEGDFATLQDIRDVVLVSRVDPVSGRMARVTVGDVAEVDFAYKEIDTILRFNGEPALSIGVIREAGANVIVTMEGIREAVEELNAGILPRAGLLMYLVYDETDYINSSIDLVTQNIWIGGLLAAFILLIFLRSPRATLIISIAIPVSVIGSFVAMAAMGRSINVISLAGLAFAIGMVVDAAIVVLENIFRLREQGMPPAKAAYQGARQVWGAILVSSLTTVMVFIPILVMQQDAGQVFRDIAVAISVSVILSLIVAMTLIPALSARLLRRGDEVSSHRIPGIDQAASAFTGSIVRYTRLVARSRLVSLATIGTITGAAFVVALLLLPKLEYLPDGNQNFISGSIFPPPGYNLATMEAIASDVEDATRPYWDTQNPEGLTVAEDGTPIFDRFYFAAGTSWTWIGAASVDPAYVKDLIPVIRGPLADEPGTDGFFRQPSLFGRGFGGTRTIDLNISGPDLETIIAVAREANQLARSILPVSEGNQYRPQPGLELGAPELRIHPDRIRLADNGVTASDLAMDIDAFNSGLRVSEITMGGTKIDLTLTGPSSLVGSTQGIGQLPVVTRDGMIVPVSSLADIEITNGPTEIRRIKQQRTITLQIGLGEGVPLETGIQMIRESVIGPMEAAGLPVGVRLDLSGTADKLASTWDAMVVNLLVALVIVYLVMAVLFESFIHPLIVMVSVPVAAAGGVLGLVVLNLFHNQPLDMLTLLGFVILIGIVVNNAILIVHQTLHHMREDGMAPPQAIEEATSNRIRPIFMSTLTSVFGMLPLVLFPGAGSELYRGLGSVVVGGLMLSAVLTLALVPPLLGLFLRLTQALPKVPEVTVDQPPRAAAE